MIDLLTASQDAFFAVVKAGTPESLAKVMQHVPENTLPPLVVIGGIEATNISDDKVCVLEQHSIEIVATYRGTARRGLYAIMHAIREAVATGTLQADGALFGRPVWQQSQDDIADDGVTYQGILTFDVIVQPT